MRIKTFAFFAILTAVFPLLITGCSPKGKDIVATVGQEPISLQEYERLYLKGSANRDSAVVSSMQERERFLDLMVNYKLKLADARRMKLDQKPEIINEIQQYKGGLAASFITERELSGPGLRRLYQRRSEEIRASHVLLMLSANASPEDSAKTYTKAYEILQAARSGGDFRALALEHSQDPSVKQNDGDLYYFTAGQMVGAFEDAAFSLKTGEIVSTPVRTQYGLHILKVTDRKPAPGEIRASHIMIRFTTPNPSPEDTAAAYAKLKAVEDTLKRGGDFAALAQRNSEDPGSASRGGDLGFFTRRRWVQPFDEAAFLLRPGQISGIIRTSYGYHLIKCTDAKPRKTFEESKQELQQIYQQQHFQNEYGTLLNRLGQQVGVRRNEDAFAELIAGADSTKTVRDSGATAQVSSKVLQSELLHVGPFSLTTDSVLSLMKARQDYASTQFRTQPFKTSMDKLTEQLVWTVVADSIERVYPEFASILKEYEEGVLLYQVEQDNVWNRVTPNDSALHAYFDAHRDKFVWPDRVNFSEMRLPTEAVARTVAAQLKEGKTMEEVAIADSIRMAAPTQFETAFKKGSTSLAAKGGTVLARAVTDLKSDTTLRIQVTVQADTAKAKSKKLANKRLSAVSAQLTKLGLRPDRIIKVTRPLGSGTTAKEGASRSNIREADRLELNIVGRRVYVLGRIEELVLAPDADERARRADSLAIGSLSNPFTNRGTHSIVRLNKREPRREKTFDEAGGELSSAFQEAESKRLETEWLQGLRQRYPVVENKDVLKDAFAVTK